MPRGEFREDAVCRASTPTLCWTAMAYASLGNSQLVDFSVGGLKGYERQSQFLRVRIVLMDYFFEMMQKSSLYDDIARAFL